MPSSNTAICKVKESYFSCGGVSYPVSTVHLTLFPNSIPTCNVGISPGGDIIHKMDLLDIREAYNQILQMADNIAPAYLHLLIEETSITGTEEVVLDLKDWRVAGVGLNYLSPVSDFELVVTIEHKAFELFRSGGIYTNYKNPPPINAENAAGVTDFISACSVAKEKYYNLEQYSYETSEGDLNVTELMKRIPDPSSYIKWAYYGGPYTSIPGESIVSKEFVDAIKCTMLESFVYPEHNSIWNIYQNTVVSQYGCTILPQTNDLLWLGPYEPWQTKTSVVLDTSRISTILLPGLDPNPIFGTFYDSPVKGFDNNVVSSWGSRIGQELETCYSGRAYAPLPTKTIGELLSVSKPFWIDSAKEYLVNEKPTSVVSTGGEYDEQIATGKNEDTIDGKKLEDASLKELFMSEFKMNYQAGCTLPLTTFINGQELLPGVHAIVDDPIGGTIFEGWTTSIEHDIDCAQSIASTNVRLSHCRGAKQWDEIIATGELNPLY